MTRYRQDLENEARRAEMGKFLGDTIYQSHLAGYDREDGAQASRLGSLFPGA
jgi:hypothetical protein